MDNRKYPRICKKFSVSIGIVSYPPDQEPRNNCQSKDMGEGGICVFSSNPFPPSTLVDLNISISGWQLYKKTFSYLIDLSSENPLIVLGHVVWCESLFDGFGHEVGIEFLDICDDDRVALENYLNNRV